MVIDQLRSSEAVIGDFPLYTGSPGLLTSDVNVAWNIYDLDGTTLSDTLSFTGTAGGNFVHISFLSEGFPGLLPLLNAQSVIETGDWQTGLNATLSNGDTFIYQFRSNETPLPGAIWLFGSALAGAVWRAQMAKETKGCTRSRSRLTKHGIKNSERPASRRSLSVSVLIMLQGVWSLKWHKADNPVAPAFVRFRTTADKRDFCPAMLCRLLTHEQT